MDKSSNTWIDKYRPKCIKDIVCNISNVNSIKHWLNNYNSYRKLTLEKIKKATKKGRKRKKIKNGNSVINSCMIVIGEHGVGKTMIVNTILNEYGFKIRSINLNKFKSGINITKYVDKIVQNQNIVSAIKNIKNEKIAIVIDNMESITGKKKKIVTQLHKYNNLEWDCPIIFISSNKHVKWINEIKKSSFCVKVEFPQKENMKKILEHIIKSEGIKINIKNKKICDIILYHCQSDIRRLINILFDIQMMCNNKVITTNIINEYIYRSQKKDIELGLFDAAKKLLYGYKDIDTCLKLYEMDKTHLPLMIQQHYIPNIRARNPNKNCYKKIKKIAQYLSRGDVIKNYIYSSQHWDIYEINGIFTCGLPSYIMNKKSPFRLKQLKYPADLNKTSIKNINKKNIVKAKKCFTNMNIMDYIFMNMIVKDYIENDDIKGCVKLMMNYKNINVGFVESLLKIDKIKLNISKTSKNGLTNKQKKEFTKYLTKYKKII